MQEVVSGIVGVEKLYYAKITSDIPGGMTAFATPVYLQGIKEIGIKVTINTEKLYAENKVWESDTAFDSTEVTVNAVDLLNTENADLMGHKLAETGGIIYSEKDVAPDVALLFKANKANGKSRYVILYNNKFTDSDETYKGKEGKTEFQTKSIVSTGAALKSNGMWKYVVDEEDGMTDEIFFNSVIIPTVMTYADVIYSSYSSGDITDISVDGITFDSVSKAFKNVPSNTTSFTFKVDGTDVTATKSDSTWSFA